MGRQVLLLANDFGLKSVLSFRMRAIPERAVLTVTRNQGVWWVEHEGATFGHSPDKEIAKAAANRHAREMQDKGRPCQVRVHGEHGFYPV